jgi:hypothetical protein
MGKEGWGVDAETGTIPTIMTKFETERAFTFTIAWWEFDDYWARRHLAEWAPRPRDINMHLCY